MKFSLRTFILSVVVCCCVARPQIQQVPDQVQQFLQQSFFSKLEQVAEEGVEHAKGVISQISNFTTAHLQFDHGTEPEKTIPEIPSTAELEAHTESVTEAIDDGESTTIMSTSHSQSEESSKNKTIIVNYLDQEGIAKMKELCPELANATDNVIVRYRYYSPSNTCVRYGLQGPCGEGMKIYIKEYGSIHGQCECKLDNRMYLYVEKNNVCYKIFTQGDCPEGKYLDLTKEGKTICAENPCASLGKEFFKIKGICTEIGQPNPEVCTENTQAVVDFTFRRRSPHCILTQRLVTGVGILPCPVGSSLAFSGKCQPDEWDFGQEDN